MQPRQVFILSPASTRGQRAALLFNDRATFFLARQLRTTGAPLADVFSFLSGLYFRGKITYARAFSDPSQTPSGIQVITTGRGLQGPEQIVTLDDLKELAKVPIDLREARYRDPLARAAKQLATELAPGGTAVLLGSIASEKYVEILREAFGDRLVFPQAFVGRGDMSRGGLLLRAVDAGEELTYVPLTGAIRRGPRPAKLPPRQNNRGLREFRG
jgi:hypothetical protein